MSDAATAGLRVGDPVPPFSLPAHSGGTFGSVDLVGMPWLILFHRGDADGPLLRSLGASSSQFARLGVRVLAVGVDPVEAQSKLARDNAVSFPLLSDGEAKLLAACGVRRGAECTILVDPNHRIVRRYDQINPATHVEELLADAQTLLAAEEPRQIQQHAPVLLIPNVLPGDFCRELIEVWNNQGNVDSGFMKQIDGKTVGLYDHAHKIRRDHFIDKNNPVLHRIKRCMSGRVVPEMRKAFNYEVTRFEDFRIACYDAGRGGYFRPHRDNTTDGTVHRRFAMSLLLNDDYEGGALRFPEYGRHTYRPAAGAAVVFSCSLLHEATDVTGGLRFVLLSFFYGEREAKMREDYNRRSGGNYRA